MSTLGERLDRIRKSFELQAPDEVKAIRQKVPEDLRSSGILARIPEPGDPLPHFELPDSKGSPVRFAKLLGQGPLVVCFHRGHW